MSNNDNNIVQMVVEIPKNSSNKYEYDWKAKTMILDRVLYGANFYPGEYGYLPQTLDYDGDPLDIISLITYPTFPGCLIEVRILGMIKMIDGGEIDNKLFGVVNSDPRFNEYQELTDVPQHLRDEIVNFFIQYKELQKKKVIIEGWSNLKAALTEIATCKNMFKQYQNEMNNLPKAQLVALLNKIK